DVQLARHRALGTAAAGVAKGDGALVDEQFAQRALVGNVLEVETPGALLEAGVLDEGHGAGRNLLGPHSFDERHRHVPAAPAYLRVVLGAFDRLDVLNRGHVLLEMVEQGRIEHGRDDGFDGSVEGVFETEVHDGGSLHQRPGYGFSARLDFTLRMGPRMLMDIESSSTLPDTSTETPSEKGPPPSSSK